MSIPATPALMLEFTSRHNISLIADFHNEINRSLAQRRADIEKAIEQATSHEEKISLMSARETFSGTFDPMLKATTFLLIYSHVEEYLYHLWKTKAKDSVLDTRNGSIKRFKPMLQVIGFDLGKDSRWAFLCDSSEVRECLLHANGRVSLMRDPSVIRRIIDKYSDELSIYSDRVRVSPQFVRRFQEVVISLFSSSKPE